MEDNWIRLAVVGVLFVLSAFFSGSETALMAIDRLRLKYLVQKKRRGARRLEQMLEHPEHLLGAILVGNNLVNIALSVLATGFFVGRYGERGELLAILVLTPLLLLLAEVSPKSLAARYPEEVSFKVLRPIRAVTVLLAPVVWVVTAFSKALNSFIASREEPRPVISEDEIRTLITVGEETGVVARDKRKMLHGVFELARTRVRDVMIPRTEVVGIEASAPFDEVLGLIQKAHHSRFPVFEENLDRVVGVIHSKDILSYVGREGEFSLREAARAPYFVPESQPIEALLQALRKMRIHLAMVVDEYGGVEGIATLEDIVEEIVGEIRDEYDVEEVLLRQLEPGRFLLDGSVQIKTVNRRFGLHLSEEHATTLAGFLLRTLGTIPDEGECCETEGASFVVRKVVDRRIEEIEVVLPQESPQP